MTFVATEPEPLSAPPLQQAGHRVAAVMEQTDWASSPLGAPDSWPQQLRMVFALILDSKFPMWVAWGTDLSLLYNDAMLEILGHKHPAAMGQPLRLVWREIWDEVLPILNRALAGEAQFYENLPLVIRRSGFHETASFTFSYSPIRDERGTVRGIFCATVETTQQVAAERNLTLANERMQLALNAGAIAGTWMWDLRDNRFIADALFQQTFGLPEDNSAEGLPVESLFDMIHPDDREAVRGLVTSTLDQGGAYRAEYRVRQRDGSYRWIEANGRCEHDVTGRAIRFPGVILDIHNRKLAELALADSERRFRTMSDAMPGFAWTADAAGMIDYTSQQWHDFSGATPQQSHGAGWARYLHPDDLDRSLAAWSRSIQTGEPYDTEYRLRRRDGTYRWFALRAMPVRDEQGAILRWVGTANDAQEMVAAREVLARSREDLERRVAEATRERNTIWRTTPNLVVVVDRSGRIKAANPAWETVLGWSELDLLAMSIVDLEHPDDRARADVTRGEILSDNGLVSVEMRFRHRDGSYRWIAWNAAPDGEWIYAIGRDMTAEREQAQALRDAEEQLRQAHKMEAIGQLTGGIAHDFNNLLTGIIGSLDLLKRRTAAGRTQDTDRFIDAAIVSANRAASLTQRLLAYSRRQSLDLKPVDLNLLVSSMADLLRRSLGEQVRLRFDLQATADTVEGDPTQIETALLNLAINARDAMPAGGVLTVATENIAADAPRPADLEAGDYVMLRVSDTGTGMPQSVIERAFDPFFTTKPLGEGTGLGLSMVYGYAKQSRGHVSIESRVGEGTAITLYLPRHAGAPHVADATSPAAAARSGRGETILVIEDDPSVRLTVTEVLRELGYVAVEAADGRTALPILESTRHLDLMVSDVGLPGLNGRQLATIARQHRPDLKVLFMTGYAEEAAVRAGFLDPGMDLITKPFALDDLASRVRGMIERR